MKIGRKGISPRYPVLRQAYAFDGAVGVLLSHLRANNSQEIDALRDAAKMAITSIFEHVRNRIEPVGKEAALEVKLRHNDTVSWLRVRYIKAINKASKSTFGYKI